MISGKVLCWKQQHWSCVCSGILIWFKKDFCTKETCKPFFLSRLHNKVIYCTTILSSPLFPINFLFLPSILQGPTTTRPYLKKWILVWFSCEFQRFFFQNMLKNSKFQRNCVQNIPGWPLASYSPSKTWSILVSKILVSETAAYTHCHAPGHLGEKWWSRSGTSLGILQQKWKQGIHHKKAARLSWKKKEVWI